MRPTILKTLCLSLFSALYNPVWAADSHQDVLQKLHLPEGFKISVYADNLPNARSLALGDKGVVFVGTGKEGKVYAVPDSNGDGIAEPHHLIASDLTMPNGVAYKDGALYVAAISRILRYDAITEHLDHPPAPVVVYGQFPEDKHHGWKYLRFGPDGKLYTAVGAPCNICLPEKDIYTSLVRLNLDGSGLEILARGIRNTVGFDWQPQTGVLYFNDNGRDHLGDDVPPDELNRWTSKGEHFGYPYCHGGDIPDPELADGKKCADFTAPVWKYPAHIAPLGMRFYQGQQFPAAYKNQLLVAQHGSWNRTEPQGYKVVLMKLDSQGHVTAEENFISGWLDKDGSVSGRPVDILAMPDGSLLISDDKNGLIYKVGYQVGNK
jgi:glucose/arabinose dehydrogenase